MDRQLEINGQPVPTRVVTLPWQEAGKSFTSTGYGRRIPTRYMVQAPGSTRWRRVYCCIFSNSGTCYIEGKDRKPNGKRSWIVVSD